MQPECEVDDDAEVPAAAAQRPEQIAVFALACAQNIPRRGDDCCREQVVERQPVQTDQVADATAEGQAADTRVAERPSRRRQSVTLAGRVEVLPERAAAAGRRARVRVDRHASHQA